MYSELERINSKSNVKTASKGEALFLSAGFFVDYEKLVNNNIQILIKKYIYSKASNTPPYTSIQDTPAVFIDDFLIIDEEVQAIQNSGDTSKSAKRKK